MILTRDVVAAALAVLLFQLTWRNDNHLESASVHLAFYLPTKSPSNINTNHNPSLDEESNNKSTRRSHDQLLLSPPPTVLDLDGDGIPEALTLLELEEDKPSQHGHAQPPRWNLRILDLKPGPSIPFRPRVLWETKMILPEIDDIHNSSRSLHHTGAQLMWPLDSVTGQVFVKHSHHDATHKATTDSTKDESTKDVSIHYYCGTDWHDAASRCHLPCPSGTSSDCPEGERCYADTPCSSLDEKRSQDEIDQEGLKQIKSAWHLTPAGGLPSIVTLWSSGQVSLYSLTGDKTKRTLDKTNSKRQKERSKQGPASELQLRPMWAVSLLPDRTITKWSESRVILVDAVTAGNDHGVVLVSGKISIHNHEEDTEQKESSLVVALDALTGKVLWNSLLDDDEQFHSDPGEDQLPLPFHRGTTSTARRRSRIPNLYAATAKDTGAGMITNCWHTYRRSLLTSEALPYQYWSSSDTKMDALHFEVQHNPNQYHALHSGKGHTTKTIPEPGIASGKVAQLESSKNLWLPWLLNTSLDQPKNRKRRHRRRQFHHGRPNVVVTHTQEGLHIRSLKNGRPLCHMSLLRNTLYTDLNHDGVLDSVQVLMGVNSALSENDEEENNEWALALARKVTSNTDDKETEQELDAQQLAEIPLCHLLALSGLPAKEEIFSADLCGDAHSDLSDAPVSGPPLVVESLYGRGERDVVAAISTGIVYRVSGTSGRIQWKLVGTRHTRVFPSWTDPSQMILSRIETESIVPSNWPVILVGEDSLALIAVHGGRLLASTPFPQMSTSPDHNHHHRRPVLVDFNGDGTTDAIVTTSDAIWGYQIIVRTGASVFTRLLVGLLYLGILLALVQNRSGSSRGKRSTDL